MRRWLACVALCGSIWAAPAWAVLPDEMLPDAAQEARARTLSGELRCMVCQNQSIDDSDADLARDLRLLLRERILAGDTDGQALDFLVSRYGEFVLLKPRWNSRNALLWLAPGLILLLGLGAVVWAARGSGRTPDRALNAAEEARVADLLGDDQRP